MYNIFIQIFLFLYTIFILRRDFNKVAAFRSTTFWIVVNLTYFQVISRMGFCWQTSRQLSLRLFSFFLLSLQGWPHNRTYLFLIFLLTVFPRRDPTSGPKIVWSFLISVTLIGQFFNMLSRTTRSKSAADGRPTMLYADLAFSASSISLFLKSYLFSWTICTNVTSCFFLFGLQLWYYCPLLLLRKWIRL